MNDATFTLMVVDGVECKPMRGLSSYEMAHRVELLREWYGADIATVEIALDPIKEESDD